MRAIIDKLTGHRIASAKCASAATLAVRNTPISRIAAIDHQERFSAP